MTVAKYGSEPTIEPIPVLGISQTSELGLADLKTREFHSNNDALLFSQSKVLFMQILFPRLILVLQSHRLLESILRPEMTPFLVLYSFKTPSVLKPFLRFQVNKNLF